MMLRDATTTDTQLSEADRDRFVSKGAAFFSLGQPAATRDFYFMMLPKMTMLAFSAAVEPLRIANQLTGKCLYRWYLLSEDALPVRCSNAVSIVVDGGLTETKSGDTVFVCSGVDGYLAASQRTISWLRDQARHGRTIGGVCTGAFTLARAGLLQDKRFTLHWENQPAFEEIFPDLPITNQIYCRDGQIITCGGGDAGIDLLVSLIEENHGTGLATKVAEMCLHGIPRGEGNKQRLSIAAELGVRHPKLSAILNDMRAGFAGDIDVEHLAARHGLSRRQMERLFHDRLKTSPAARLRDIRVDQAHSLISETDMSLMEIAVACGFQSQAALRKAYRQRFGVVPSFKMRQQPNKP
ncbi:MAG: GlxA family transcriptional regulator [Aestuariivirga sp.]|jgi:transcriptional regulator GlxA family with amidase domain|uniref:GlxA family transcriptional regulator n=1 Tax=Aestuariivirga sp. TaxID=2650926 RepID=UPI00301A125A